MKRKLKGVLGVGLTLVMVLSLTLIFAPVATAADYTENDWGEWGLPDTDPYTDVGPMAIAPDGTIFASVFFWDDVDADEVRDRDEWFWKVVMSEDDGYTWDDTDLDPAIAPIVDIAISPNYAEDETLYVGCADGTVYRLEEAGDDVTALKPLVDSAGNYADSLYSIDVYTDDADYNWILVGTELDVLVLKDKVFEDWRDQELGSIYDLTGSDENYGLEVAFAPDFDESELIWAVTVDPTTNGFLVTSTESPGKWGQDVDEALIEDETDTPVVWTTAVDIDFPDDYDSDDAVVYVGVTSGGGGVSGVYLFEGVDGDGDATDFESVCVELTVGEGVGDINSIAASGDYGDVAILAGELGAPVVWISDDGDGEDWDDADKNPTGQGSTYVYMEADVVWGGAVFDTEESMAFATTSGDESAVSRSNDGGWVYNQVGYIDHTIDELWDLAFHPDFPDEAVFLLITEDESDNTSSLWLTENGDEDDPDYIRVLCGAGTDPPEPGNLKGFFGDLGVGYHGLVEFAQDASAIYLHGEDDTNDESIWKSTNDGQTFGKRRDVKSSGVKAEIMDWVITDDNNIYAAVDSGTDYGFYTTVNSGLSWQRADTDGAMNSIALSSDFDAEEEEGYILLGGLTGEIMLSDDVGDSFDDAEDEEQSDLSNTAAIFVAFDADFADEDADGYMYIYAADDAGSAIQEGEVADTDDVDWDELEDDDGDGLAQPIYCVGLQVAEDNALYAMGEVTEAVTVVVTVDGFFEIDATTGGPDTITIVGAIEVDVISGTFEDGEDVVDVVSADLNADSSTVVSGTIYIEGDDSGALGSFDITIVGLTGYAEDEDVAVIDYTDGDLDIDVTEEAVGVGLVRLLLHESNNLWESQDDTKLDDPMGLWLTPGTNVLWTIDIHTTATVAPDVWALEDTCSGQVTLDSPPDGYKSDYEDQMRVSWDEVRDADEYEVKYYHVDTGDSTVEDEIEDTDVLLTGLSDSSEYEWKVRVSPDEPWHSRWSGKWSFHTALGEPPWAPTLYTPGGVWQYSGIDVDLMPAFSWESAKNADSYQFMLADNAAFTSPLVNEKVPESAYNLDFELEYNSNYFWRVMAYDGNTAISRWSDIGAFTTVEKVVPAPPAPTPTLTVEPAVPIVLPTPIPPALLWTIIGIGALLIIAVIVLIVRTRRPV